MPLNQTSGNATADSFGGGVAAVPNYIEDVFSTYLYTGNATARSISNGVDLSTKGGMVWIKSRSDAVSHDIFDTARGAGHILWTNSTSADNYTADTQKTLTSFNTDGFSLGTDTGYWGANSPGYTFASWTFRKQPKFFDVVTYTGNGSAGRTISHSLGSVPGCVIYKQTSASGEHWGVYHRSLSSGKYLWLDSTNAENTLSNRITALSSTDITIGSNAEINANGATYVAYLFAHDAGGFGLTGTDNVISCGGWTAASPPAAGFVDLGWEPQWIMFRRTDIADSWWMYDTMRGWIAPHPSDRSRRLYANSSAAEAGAGSDTPSVTSTGFYVNSDWTANNFIYIAIRRGPMKVPTDATKVFKPTTTAGTGVVVNTTFPVDMNIYGFRSGNINSQAVNDRLRGVTTTATQASSPTVKTAATDAENLGIATVSWNNTGFTTPTTLGVSLVHWSFRRAPSFFDEVCYTGDSTLGRAVPHNLGASPELMIVKNRNNTENWVVYSAATGATKRLILNSTAAAGVRAIWADTTPTSTNFYVGGSGVLGETNYTTYTYVAYLFATCAGVSKVGSYTGTGATQTIDCGFTGGARWVLIKRTDGVGSWYVWDTARGMVSGTDPSLLLNSTAAEVNANSIYTTTGGFQVVSTAAGINASGGTYIFLAIA